MNKWLLTCLSKLESSEHSLKRLQLLQASCKAGSLALLLSSLPGQTKPKLLFIIYHFPPHFAWTSWWPPCQSSSKFFQWSFFVSQAGTLSQPDYADCWIIYPKQRGNHGVRFDRDLAQSYSSPAILVAYTVRTGSFFFPARQNLDFLQLLL